MECKIINDPNCREQVLVYAKEENELTQEIRRLVSEQALELVGFNEDREGTVLKLSDIYCIISQDDKIFAITKDERLQLRGRLYQLEEKLSGDFIKINQSCFCSNISCYLVYGVYNCKSGKQKA